MAYCLVLYASAPEGRFKTLEGYLHRRLLNFRATDQVACHIIELKNWEKKHCVMSPSLPLRAEADLTGK